MKILLFPDDAGSTNNGQTPPPVDSATAAANLQTFIATTQETPASVPAPADPVPPATVQPPPPAKTEAKTDGKTDGKLAATPKPMTTALANPEALTIEAALTRAKDGLKLALQSARNNLIGDGLSINKLENEFENAKNILSAGKAGVGHLCNARGGLKLAVDLLANHTLANANDLRAVRNAHGRATTDLAQLPPTV